jgi:DNA-binding transcriptional LysR family regulator
MEIDEVCVLPDGHPLLKKCVVSLPDLEGQRFISLSSNDPYRIELDNSFASMGIERQMVIETPSAVSVCSLVRRGLGVAIVNPLTALDFVGRNLHIRPLSSSYPFRVSIVQPQHRALNPMTASFITALREEARELQRELDTLVRAAATQ